MLKLMPVVAMTLVPPVSRWVRLPNNHYDIIKQKNFPRYWPFVRGIHRSPVNSPHIGQWRGALVFSLICALTNGQLNNREAGDLRRHRAHYDVIVMIPQKISIVTVLLKAIHAGFCAFSPVLTIELLVISWDLVSHYEWRDPCVILMSSLSY